MSFDPFAPNTTVPTTGADAGEVEWIDVENSPYPLNPIDNPTAFDYGLLNGTPTPGVIMEIAGASNPRKWDERAGTGQSGATIVYMGDGLCKFSVKLLLWLPEHFEAWDTFKPLLKPPTVKKPNALDWWHPYTDLLPVPVKAVAVTDVKAPTQHADGLWSAQIDFIQFRMPKAAGAKPPSGYVDSGDKVDDMINGLKKDMDNLLK